MKCILSGLEISKADVSREHLCPRHRVPKIIWNNPENVFNAHYLLNSIKSDFLPCEWNEEKYSLVEYALRKWKLQQSERDFLNKAVANWKAGYNPDWCSLCLLKCKTNQR